MIPPPTPENPQTPDVIQAAQAYLAAARNPLFANHSPRPWPWSRELWQPAPEVLGRLRQAKALIETAVTMLESEPFWSSHCPYCGEPWEGHDFGVPAPVCPKKGLTREERAALEAAHGPALRAPLESTSQG